tara:strand:+ start:89 stop:697 length:609 start_codon:yes stop_codon:yes gene_type:complete
MNWKDIKKLIKEELKEAQVTAGDTKFNLRMGVNKNPTKLGIKIQFEPLKGIIKTDVKDKLTVALQEKLNSVLQKYKFQISLDTDVPRPEVIGFFIPLSQIKALVTEALGQGEAETPDAPLAPEPTGSEEESPIDEIEAFLNEHIINEMKIRDLNEASKIVKKDDFYGFINAGNNIIRDMEAAGKTVSEAKKYLAYLTKHNIM